VIKGVVATGYGGGGTMDFENPDRSHMFFDAVLNSGLVSAFFPFYRRYVEGLGLKGNERLLEFGSGTGAASRYFAEILLKGNGRLVCVDRSEAMSRVARKRLKKYPDVEIKVGDIRTLDVEDGSYDAASIHFMLHDVDAGVRLDTVKALARKLKPGGRLFLREPTAKFKAMSTDAMREVLTQAGLEEAAYRFTKSFLFGPMYEAVYTKRKS
jgi:ubiquinone/menaquinone biosynthesis C-methylase UbiE